MRRLGIIDQGIQLRDLVGLIVNTPVKDFVYEALTEAHPDFWKCPASSSGKYHPPEDNGIGGTVRHTIKCVKVTESLLGYFGLNLDVEKDIAIAATILHDICKNGYPEQWAVHTNNQHGLIAYHWLDQFELKSKYVKELIKNAVRYHMSIWSVPKEEAIVAVNNASAIVRIVQVADMVASRIGISYFPGIDLKVNQEGDLLIK